MACMDDIDGIVFEYDSQTLIQYLDQFFVLTRVHFIKDKLHELVHEFSDGSFSLLQIHGAEFGKVIPRKVLAIRSSLMPIIKELPRYLSYFRLHLNLAPLTDSICMNMLEDGVLKMGKTDSFYLLAERGEVFKSDCILNLVFQWLDRTDFVSYSVTSKHRHFISHSLSCSSEMLNRCKHTISLILSRYPFQFCAVVAVLDNIIVWFDKQNNNLLVYDSKQRSHFPIGSPYIGSEVLGTNTFGLGYDRLEEHNYVLCWFCDGYRLAVFTFNDLKWCFVPCNYCVREDEGVYFADSVIFLEDGYRRRIIQYDIDHKKLYSYDHTQRLGYPTSRRARRKGLSYLKYREYGDFTNHGIGVMAGRLFLCEMESKPLTLKLMAIKKCEGSDLSEFEIVAALPLPRGFKKSSRLTPLYFLADGRVLFLMDNTEFLAYSFRFKVWNHLDQHQLVPLDQDGLPEHFGKLNAFPYHHGNLKPLYFSESYAVTVVEKGESKVYSMVNVQQPKTRVTKLCHLFDDLDLNRRGNITPCKRKRNMKHFPSNKKIKCQ